MSIMKQVCVSRYFVYWKMFAKQGVLFHVDAAQSVGKMAIDLKNLPIDLMSLASHKV